MLTQVDSHHKIVNELMHLYTFQYPPPPPHPTPVIINTPVVLIIFRSLANTFDLYDMYSSKILCTRSVTCHSMMLCTGSQPNLLYTLYQFKMWCTISAYLCLVFKIYKTQQCLYMYDMYIYILRACEENLCTTTLYVCVCMCVCICIFTCSSLLRIDCE